MRRDNRRGMSTPRSKGAYLITRRVTPGRPFGSLSHTVDDAIDSDALVFDRDKLLKERPRFSRTGIARVVLGIGDLPLPSSPEATSRAVRRRVVLVDHNERSQSAAGIDGGRGLRYRRPPPCRRHPDQHPIPDFLDLPLGSTATIVAREYVISDVPIPVPMAAIMLSAMMTSRAAPQVADHDEKRIAGWLSVWEIIERDPLEFGMDVIEVAAATEGVKVGIIGADAKNIGDNVVLVVQHETTWPRGLLSVRTRSARREQTIEQRT